MIRFEEYKSNLEVTDKFGTHNVNVNKKFIYNSHHKIFTLTKNDDNNCQRTRTIAAAVLGLGNTDIPLPNDVESHNFWHDMDAQESYLTQKPKTYLILGKQGIGSYTLGESMSKKINCIHICPKNVLQDEIDQKSITGRCLDFNMRHNKVLQYKTILAIMKKKIISPAVQHRGFVISGLPLVTSSKDIKYLLNTLNGEESLFIVEYVLFDLIHNLKKKHFQKKSSSPHSSISSENFEIAVESLVEEEQELQPEENEDQIVELPKFLLETCSDIILPSKVYYSTKKYILLQQLYEIFDLKPDIVIYITCPSSDALTKRSHKFFNYLSNTNTFSPFANIDNNLYNDIRWPTYYIRTDYKRPFETHTFNFKYNCAQPIHFKKNVTDQICNYKVTVTLFLDEKLKEIHPHNVIKLDGRTSVHEMINLTIETLQLMQIKPVLIPEPLYVEDPPNDMEEFWRIVEELNVIRSGVMNFNRYASPWYNRCPVALKKRQSVIGNPKFAVTFFKHIYLLSSLEAMLSFCRNPRPFLKLEYLEPTCRIIILGTKSSGKTMIAKCLSWIFNAPIICYTTFLANERIKKYNTFAKTILSEIITSIEEARFAKWQSIELERISNLKTWFNGVSSLLTSYIPLLVKKLNDQEESVDDDNSVFLGHFNSLRNQLSFLPTYFLNDLNKCQQLVTDQNLLRYAPTSLTIQTCKPTIPTLGDDDVIEEISAYISHKELQKETEPTAEELMSEIVNLLQTIDSQSVQSPSKQIYGKFIIDGFPSDPEYWGYLVKCNLLPDYTIAVLENREVDVELFQHYEKIEKCVKNYQERYLSANDVLLKTKLLLDNPPDCTLIDVQSIIDEVIANALTSIFFNNGTGATEETIGTDILSFIDSIERFREDCGILKLKLEDNLKSFIEVEIEDKTDIEMLDEVLLKLRKSYCRPCLIKENDADNYEDENEFPRDELTYNDPRMLGETNIYCPVTFHDYGVLWEGKPELSTVYDNKLYYIINEECRETLQYDITKYLSYNKPFKNIPPLRICVVGTIGSGKTSISKIIAKELGLMHINFLDFLNTFLIPKHFKKVGWQYENSFTDNFLNDEVEFQMDEENIFSDILSNEQELRRMVYNYLEQGSPLQSILMHKLIKKLWFENPFRTTGFVLDGFPKLPTDLEDMVTCFCIPDVIIELEGSSETTLNRLSSIKLNDWKLQLKEAKEKAKTKLEAEKNEWRQFGTKTTVIKLIIHEILENVISDTEDEPIINLSVQVSTIMDAHPSGSSNVDANLFKTYNEFIEEYPEPVDQQEWEKADDVLEKINNRLESIYEIDNENIQTLKDTLDEQKIKLISLDGTKALKKVVKRALSSLSELHNRCESLFEQTFIINCDIAEMLLLEGFFLLSKFNRMCPVFIMENPHTILNPYTSNKYKNKIFPIIHRAYIYFISSEKNVKKFRFNPLKYVQNETIKFFKRYALKIGVIGPPKSGKSKLAAQLAKKYGLVCISKGKAIRHILEHMHWTNLGFQITESLRAGEVIDRDLIMKAVLTIAIDHRTITNGFVLDGFPESPYDVYELSKNDIFPLIMFDLNSDKEIVLANSQSELHYNILTRKPPYPRSLIEFRYRKWCDKSSRVRDWINQDTQNLHTINGNNSKWQCFVDAYMKIEDVIPKIHYYLTHSKSDIVRLDMMCISRDTFQQRMSCFKNLCPVCLKKNTLRHSGYPPDNKGVVQFEDCYYWICRNHLSLVLQYPQKILSTKEINIPEIPVVVKSINLSLVHENGICVVTYAENLPSHKFLRGKSEYAASYRKKVYLLCSSKCMNKFLSKPHMYYNIKVFKEISVFPEISVPKLPHLGYLEQTVGSLMTDACCAVNVLRPKYPGLTTSISALLYIALYLKIRSPFINKSQIPMYSKAFRIFEARCKLIMEIGLRLRSMDNPFANYPSCCNKSSTPNQTDSGTVGKPSSIISSCTNSLYFESDFKKFIA